MSEFGLNGGDSEEEKSDLGVCGVSGDASGPVGFRSLGFPWSSLVGVVLARDSLYGEGGAGEDGLSIEEARGS